MPSLRIHLVTAFVAVILITCTSIALVSDRAHRATALQLSERVLAEVAAGVVAQTSSGVAPARAAADLLASRGSPDALVLVDVLEASPALESVYVADPAGTLIQARRAEGGVAIRRVEQGPPAMEVVADPGQPERRGPTDYDPRKRTWWAAATASPARGVWTEPYLFHTRRKPGLTAARAIREPDGRVVGVVGADILLTDLAERLRALPLDRGGRALVVTRSGAVVGHPDPRIFEGPDGGVRQPTLAEMGSPWADPAVLAAVAEGRRATLRLEDGRWAAAIEPFPADVGAGWSVLVAVPMAAITGPADRARAAAVGVTGLVLLVAVGVAWLLSAQISGPIVGLASRVQRVAALELDADFSTTSRIAEVQAMSAALGAMQAGLESFRRYVPTRLVRRLMRSGQVARLGGEERVVAVLFCDLRGYTTTVENLPPPKVVEILNRWFGEMARIAESHGAGLIDYVGDALLVVWGAPDALPDAGAAGVRCALEMRAAMDALNDGWEADGSAAAWKQAGLQKLSARFGVHMGPVVAGNMGSAAQLKYCVVGDTVNVASRLEQLNKTLGTEILVSAEVYATLPADLAARGSQAGTVTLRGRAREQTVYGFTAG
jgi:adenylate cyclase